MVAAPAAPPVRSRPTLALILLAGAGVAVVIGVYARLAPASRPLFLLGFSGMLQLKTWLATAALALVVVRVITALWIWDRLPLAGRAPAWLPTLHRWSGSVGFTLTLPVALHCVWSLGLVTASPRVLAHGVLGCAAPAGPPRRTPTARRPRAAAGCWWPSTGYRSLAAWCWHATASS